MLKILNINDKCTGCGACVNSCTKLALRLDYNAEGFYYPFLNANSCVQCGLCERMCPVLNEKVTEKIPRVDAYMIKSPEEEVVFNSTSGGAFTIFANCIIKKGGIVFASRYNYETNRLEVTNTDKYPVSDFRKSKYMESYVGESFKDIKKQLQDGRSVIFVGTPCQAIGLRTFIPKHLQGNLLIVDFVCHGVPSNQHHTEYKLWLEESLKEKILYLDFRPKQYGWGPIYYHYKTNYSEKFIPGHNSYFYHAFQHSYFLRKSCYICERSKLSDADITIGDFWGLKKYAPYRVEKEGVSVCICRSEKGLSFLSHFDMEKEGIERLPIDAVEYIFSDRSNDNSFQYVSREKFSVLLKKHGYMGTVKRVYWKEMYMIRLKQFIKDIIYR